MKFLLLATFVVFCAASTVYRGKNISVTDDGSILITSSTGKRVVITKSIGYDGQKAVDITIGGPNFPTKRIQINEDDTEVRSNRYPWSSTNSVEDDQLRGKRSSKREKSQADVLFEILREYQGPVSEPLFEKLLGKIEKAVKKGEISRRIYDLLVELDQIDYPESEIGNQGIFGGQTIVPDRYVSWYTRLVPQIQGGRVVVVQEQVPLVQGGLYGQNWGTTRYVNPLLESLLQGQQYNRGVYSGFPIGQQLNSGISGRLLTRQNIIDELLAQQQLNSGVPLSLQTQQDLIDEILVQQQLNSGVPRRLQTQQDLIDEILVQQQLNSGVPRSLQTQQAIVDEILARQQLNSGVPRSLQSQQDIIDEILARQQLRGGVPVSLQTQQNIVDEILARQRLNGGVPLSLQIQQDIIDVLLARQQLNGGLPVSLQTQRDIVDELLARQQLSRGGYSGMQTDRNIIGGLLRSQQSNTGFSRGLQGRQNIVDEVLEQQQLDNDVVRALEVEEQQQQQQEQLEQLQQLQQLQQVGGVSGNLQSGQNVVGNLLRRQPLNNGVGYLQGGMRSNIDGTRGVLGRRNVLLNEYLTGSQQVPYSQRQSFGALWGMLMNRPTGYYNQGWKEGYRMTQRQPTIMQTGRGVYMDNMGVPQVVY